MVAPTRLFGIARQVGNHVFEIAGGHCLFHIIFRLLDPLMRHIQCNQRCADLVCMLVNQCSRAIAHKAFGRALQTLKGFRCPGIG